VGESDRRRWRVCRRSVGLYPGMPASDQIVHFGQLHGLSRRDATKRARVLLDELGPGGSVGERTDKLSGGMQ
jgi:ABC-2 type transport system ATP-binding protein